MQLTAIPAVEGASECRPDGRMMFTGVGGGYMVEPAADGSFYILRDGGPARDGIVAHVFDRRSATIIASQKARALY